MGASNIPVMSFCLNSFTTSWILSISAPTAAAATMTAEVCRPESHSDESLSVSSRSATLWALSCLFCRRAAFTHFGAPLLVILSNTLTFSSSSLSTMAACARLRLRSDCLPFSLACFSSTCSCSALLALAARLFSDFESAFAARFSLRLSLAELFSWSFL